MHDAHARAAGLECPAMREDQASLAYVRRLCFDVLHRPPTPTELASLKGMDLARVARQIWRRREAMSEWLEEELWFHLLIDRFRPRTPAIEALPDRLAQGKASARDATAEILLSTGFSLRNPGNDTFVTVVLESCLGITVQERRAKAELEAGKLLYDGRSARFLGETGNSQADIVRIVLDQDAFRERLLDRHHQRLFRAPLASRGEAERGALLARLREDEQAFFAILAEWTQSPAYLAAVAVRRPRTHRELVRSLYFDVLERAPDYDELRNMRNALQSMADPAPLRAVFSKLLLDSKEAKLPAPTAADPAEFVRGCFLRYLGREPSQAETAEFTAVLAEPGANHALVVRALLTSVEYGYC